MYIGLPSLRLSSSESLENQIAALFINGEQGWWREAADPRYGPVTMWQDSAGTTPVTAVEQPVGKVLDRSGRGNHNIQATAADRPVLSARYNLLTKSEAFSHADWLKAKGGVGTVPTITDNYGSIAAPNGTFTACRVQMSIGGGVLDADYCMLSQNLSSVTIGAGVQKVWARTVSGTANLQVGVSNSVDTQTTLTETWQLVSGSIPVGENASRVLMLRGGQTPAHPNTADILIWHPDLRLTADTLLNIPAYQRVNTATDYDTDGFPHYFRLNGTNQSWATAGTVDFTGTDKVSLVYGVTTIGAATTAILAELSATANSNNGSFYVLSPASAGAGFAVATRGTVAANAGGRQEGATAANRSAVFSSALNLAGTTNAETVSVRVNGVVATTSDLNTVNNGGNFGNYTAYTGRRAGSSLPFNGRIYSEIAVGATITATQITAVERYTARRMGVQL
jgi:hypothetical protein